MAEPREHGRVESLVQDRFTGDRPERGDKVSMVGLAHPVEGVMMAMSVLSQVGSAGESGGSVLMAVVWIGLGYLVGAIPFGWLIARSRGVNIREHGSGNIGATNVGRVLGKGWGYGCFLLDVGKGLLPTLMAGRWLSMAWQGGDASSLSVTVQLLWLAVGASCILGHMFSVYLGFRGGKGVATSLGVVLGVWPYFTLTGIVAFLIWLAVWGWTRIVSLGSMIAAVAFPIVFALLCVRIPEWQWSQLLPLQLFAAAMAGLVILRHRSNIQRLLAGTEQSGRANTGPSAPSAPSAPSGPSDPQN